MEHWAINHIGKPWKFGASGPDIFDCWGFFCHVQKEHYNIEIKHTERFSGVHWQETASILKVQTETDWLSVECPQEGDAVLMSRNRLPVHIGIWIAANGTQGVLHCLEGAGVLFSKATGLRASGWGHLTYYRHRTK